MTSLSVNRAEQHTTNLEAIHYQTVEFRAAGVLQDVCYSNNIIVEVVRIYTGIHVSTIN